MLTIQNISSKTINNIIGVISNRYVESDKYFVTLLPIQIELTNGKTITIPKGYYFDGSSTPKFIRGIMPRYGAFMFAALIHDWMYYTDHQRERLGVDKARKFADEEMLRWSNAINNRTYVNYLDNYLRYWAVRLFGKKVYER